MDCIEGKHFFFFRRQFINQARVCKSLGKVVLTLNGLKAQLCDGEVCKFQLNISNSGNVAIQKIYLINSYPEMIGFESTEFGYVEAGTASQVYYQ